MELKLPVSFKSGTVRKSVLVGIIAVVLAIADEWTDCLNEFMYPTTADCQACVNSVRSNCYSTAWTAYQSAEIAAGTVETTCINNWQTTGPSYQGCVSAHNCSSLDEPARTYCYDEAFADCNNQAAQQTDSSIYGTCAERRKYAHETNGFDLTGRNDYCTSTAISTFEMCYYVS